MGDQQMKMSSIRCSNPECWKARGQNEAVLPKLIKQSVVDRTPDAARGKLVCYDCKLWFKAGKKVNRRQRLAAKTVRRENRRKSSTGPTPTDD
jgi:hypothetical protein